MPDHDTAVASARSAADAYTFAWLARRRAYEQSRADGPGRADEVAIAHRLISDAARRAFRAFLESLVDLKDQDGEAEALALVMEVNDRTRPAGTPVAIPITETPDADHDIEVGRADPDR